MPAVNYSSMKKEKGYDLIFADPPFYRDDIYNVVDNILNNKYLKDDCLMIIERSLKTKQNDIANLKTEPFKIIGDACLYEITN